jgi:pyruvate dehydrogenase (quinone)
MQEVALYKVEMTGPEHAAIVGNRACRAALSDRGVAHLTVAKGFRWWSARLANVRCATPERARPRRGAPTAFAPPADQLDATAAVLNAGSRVAVLVGFCKEVLKQQPMGFSHEYSYREHKFR